VIGSCKLRESVVYGDGVGVSTDAAHDASVVASGTYRVGERTQGRVITRQPSVQLGEIITGSQLKVELSRIVRYGANGGLQPLYALASDL